MYDFTTVISRQNTGSIKYDFAPEPVKGSGFVPLTIADMEFAVCPHITDAIKKAADGKIYGYTYEDEEYWQAVRGWMMRRHNWEPKREWLVTTNGVVPALNAAVCAFTEPGDGIVIQSPVYPPFWSAVKAWNRKLIENPLICDENGYYTMDFADLEAKCADPANTVKAFILCDPHNPVGRVWTKDELMKLSEICVRYGLLMIADEIHNDLILPGVEHTVYATLPNIGTNWVLCTAPSKTFNLAGLASSNIFIPDEALRKKFKEYNHIGGSGCLPFFARAATMAAYNEGGAWLDKLLEVIDGNFNYLYSFVKERLPMLKVTRAEGTYLAWVDMRALGMNAEELESFVLNKAYLALDEGYIFGDNGKGFERWNLAMPRALLKDALVRLEKAVKSL